MINASKLVEWLKGKAVKPADPILVAVSGGMDSMFLVGLAVQAKLNIQVAHVNYGLRDEDSDLDQKLVADFCKSHDLALHVSRWSPQDSETGSIQMQCRDHRYQFFEQVMEKNGLVATLLAHHSDDQVETILLNLIKGTGIIGLVGMPEKRGRFLRPLLHLSREEIASYVEANGIAYREDVSNSADKYERNFIRNQVLPTIKNRFAEAPQAILKTAINLSSAKDLLNDVSDKLKNEFLAPTHNGIIIDLHALKLQVGHQFLLYEWLKEYGFNGSQVNDMLSSTASGARFLSADHTAILNRGKLQVFRSLDKPEGSKQFHLSQPPKGWTVESYSKPEKWFPDHAINVAEFDMHKIQSEKLTLRCWEQGDRFKPLGLNGWKKLSDLFVDEKLSLLEKEQVLILTSGEDIMWVVALRIDDRFKVNKDTRTVLKLTYQD